MIQGEPPLAHYVEMLKAHKPFALSRYGDGELNCIFYHEGHNCDGHEYFHDLGLDLLGTIQEQHERPFFYGLVRVAQREMPKEVEAIHEVYRVPWVDGTVLVDASRAGELHPFIEAIRQHVSLYVGPPHLRYVYKAMRMAGHPDKCMFLTIPDENCYLHIDNIESAIRFYMAYKKPTLVLFSASMMSNVLIHRLWPEFGDRVTMIDVGSLFDGFAGQYSRKYMRDPKWQALREVNLYGNKHEEIEAAK